MNQGRIWCVVHPTVGLPLLLGSVALTSLAVHASVMSHTTWMSNYWQGAAKPKTASVDKPGQVASVTPGSDSAFAITIAPVPATNGAASTAFVVTVTPNQSVAANPAPHSETLALAAPPPK